MSALVLLAAMLPAASVKLVTFNREVLPVPQKNCQGCHLPGEATPMSFLTCTETRPYTKAIKAAVAAKKMPPWFADRSLRSCEKNRTWRAEARNRRRKSCVCKGGYGLQPAVFGQIALGSQLLTPAEIAMLVSRADSACPSAPRTSTTRPIIPTIRTPQKRSARANMTPNDKKPSQPRMDD